MRFEVSRVMDSIEERLTTDVTLAQAVVDLGEVAGFSELDGGRPANLLRIGMAVDALSRYLLDSGAMAYGVASRALLSDPALSSKERMVLGRWLDDGRIEITEDVADRAVEVADMTGLPLLAVRRYQEYAADFRWLDDSPERVLLLHPRAGSGVLAPADSADVDPTAPHEVAVGKAAITDPADAASFPEVFATHGAQRLSHTLVMRRRFTRAEPSGLGVSLMAREWRCEEDGCPAFGEQRRIGQPVPRMRKAVPSCPRHHQPLVDVGSRPRAYAISVVVEDLARQRFAVTEGQPVRVGIAEPDDGDGPPTVSVAQWAHQAAKAWIGPSHVALEVRGAELVVTDVSTTGTAIWQRSGPEDAGHTHWLYGSSYPLGDWDSVELYTGIELFRGDRRPTTMVGRAEPRSVLVDAPTAAMRHLTVEG